VKVHVIDQGTHRWTRDMGLGRIPCDPAYHDCPTTDKMTNSMSETETLTNVKAWGMTIGMAAFDPDDGIEGLHVLRGEPNGRSQVANVSWEVHKDVKLPLVEPLSSPQRRCLQEIGNGCLQLALPENQCASPDAGPSMAHQVVIDVINGRLVNQRCQPCLIGMIWDQTIQNRRRNLEDDSKISPSQRPSILNQCMTPHA